MSLALVDAGWATTIQDLGRPGRASLGVPAAGAVDRAALALANRLVGNPPGAAGLETAGGLVIEAVDALIVATSSVGHRVTLRPGERLAVSAPSDGMWGYLAIRGGIDVAPVLGSRSIDTLSGIGPPPPTTGDVLAVGPAPQTELPADLGPPRARDTTVRIWPGPHAGSLGGVESMTRSVWTVAGDVSRVGVRLVPPDDSDIEPGHHGAMASIGLVEGAVQVPPSGGPIVMLANHPTTGGYPVVAVVEPDDLPVVAQAAPGSTLRFRPV